MSASEVDFQSKKKAQYSLYGATLILLSTIGVMENWGVLGLVGIIHVAFALRWVKEDRRLLYIAMALHIISFYTFVYYYLRYFHII